MGKSKYTKEVFEMLGKAIHGENAFDYSEVIYVNSKTPVKLTCNSCGREFYQIPASHLRGRGCASCSHSGSSWTLDAFVKAARKVHGDKYQYHTIENFRGLFYKVSIFCPKHGVFEQLPDAHLRGQGCPHCWNEKRRTSVCGVGINDYNGNIRPNGMLLQSYATWQSMIKRCYDENELKKHPSYSDCVVCDEWLHFSKFKEWFDDPSNGYMDGYMLDKDILCAGNRIYSPNACCFVPHKINILVKKTYDNKDLPTGVFRLRSGRFYAMYNNEYLGTFDAIETAYDAYCSRKEDDVKTRSLDYYKKGFITEKVYNALQKYKVKQYNTQKV